MEERVQTKQYQNEREELSDLKEASKEGNSISMSPQRSGIPDMKPFPGNKMMSLKKTNVTNMKKISLSKNITGSSIATKKISKPIAEKKSKET